MSLLALATGGGYSGVAEEDRTGDMSDASSKYSKTVLPSNRPVLHRTSTKTV